MMKQSRLITAEHQDFQKAWELYKKAFPEEERRPIEFQNKIMNHPNYHFEITNNDEGFVGFILWWQFKRLKYIEHFAILKNLRGKGFGETLLKQFMTETRDEIILEVEPPIDDNGKRRISFYQRLGFKLNKHHYVQLPLRSNGKSPTMFIMTYPDEISASKLSSFTKSFRILCYDPYLA